jgi:Domain of unknown function (DUF385).
VSRRSILGLGICVAFAYWAYDWAGKNIEVVTLHASGAYSDYYTQLFIVDDPDDSKVKWIRAERPNRMWLKSVRANPEVVVHRADRDFAYRATVWDGQGDHERIDRLFRAKYGALDQAAAWFFRRDAVPIRLDPSDLYANGF